MSRRFVPIVAASALVLAAGVLPQAAVGQPRSSRAIKCGEFRWPVKTLSDRRAQGVNYKPIAASVGFLRKLPAPSSLGTFTPRIRHSAEMRTYTLQVRLLKAKIEDDHDIHPVVSAPAFPAKTMIVEFPDTHCNGAASSLKKPLLAFARAAVLKDCGSLTSSEFTSLKGTATIKGVGFFDEKHGQTGVAPNGIELHPVLSYSGSCSKTTGGGGGGGSGNCTPGYSPCLVYHGGADYDCYGGGGNGPYYTQPGVTYHVTGSDPYDLDSNHNGLGCE
jgi:hypothetical protein